MAGDGRVFRAGDAWGSGVLAGRSPAVGAGPGVSALREGAPRGRSPSAPWRTSPRAVLPTLRGVSAKISFVHEKQDYFLIQKDETN